MCLFTITLSCQKFIYLRLIWQYFYLYLIIKILISSLQKLFFP